MTKAVKILGAGVLGFFGIVMFIILIFNFFSGIVGGIWLICLGYWRIVLAGFIAVMFMHWAHAIILLPALGLSPLAILFYKKNIKSGAAITGFIIGLYDSLVVVGWLGFVFITSLVISIQNNIPMLPILLLAYSVATVPIISAASHEDRNNTNTNLTIMIVLFGSVSIIIISLLRLPLIYPIAVLVILMLLKTIIMTVLIISDISKKQVTS